MIKEYKNIAVDREDHKVAKETAAAIEVSLADYIGNLIWKDYTERHRNQMIELKVFDKGGDHVTK
jgi:hypothetical protein